MGFAVTTAAPRIVIARLGPLSRPSSARCYSSLSAHLSPSHLDKHITIVHKLHSRHVFVQARAAPSSSSLSSSSLATMASATTFHDFAPKDKKGNPYPLSSLKGKVVLVVNTASKCGFTPQFEGLEKLYQGIQATHGDRFEILGFPCNQFGSQDPGTNEEIQEFCQINYGVSFPILGKIDVNGDNADPAFEWLKSERSSMGLKRIKWNFEKFLVGSDGKVKNRWASYKKPEELKADIEKELAVKV